MSMNRRSKGLPCRPGGYGVLVQEAVKRLPCITFTQLLSTNADLKVLTGQVRFSLQSVGDVRATSAVKVCVFFKRRGRSCSGSCCPAVDGWMRSRRGIDSLQEVWGTKVTFEVR